MCNHHTLIGLLRLLPSMLCAVIVEVGYAQPDSLPPTVDEFIEGVERNDEFVSHGAFAYLERTVRDDGTVVTREGTLRYCGPYYASVSVCDDGQGSSNSFLGKTSFGRWSQDATVAQESIHAAPTPRELLSGVSFGRDGRPIIRERTGGTGYESLRDFVDEQKSKGRIINVTKTNTPEVYTVTVYDSAAAQSANSAHYVLTLRSRKTAVVTGFEERWEDGRVNRDFEIEVADADSGNYFIPKRIKASVYGPAGSGVTAQQTAGLRYSTTIELKAFTPLSRSEWDACEFTAASLELPSGVRLVRTNLDGSQSILESVGRGSFRPIEVLAPTTLPFARTSLDRSSFPSLLRGVAIAFALAGLCYLAVVWLHHRRNSKTERV